MIRGGIGGGNTKTGLIYEAKVDLTTFLNGQKGYVVKDMDIFYNEELVGNIFKKHGLYKFLKQKGIDWRKHLSKQLLPDNCIYVIINNTMNIIEVKHQEVGGSVDEKLQTCDFKKKQYKKLAKTCHPDLHPEDKEAEEKFKRLTEAYKKLLEKMS